MFALPVPWCHSALRQSGAESTRSGFCSGGLRCSLPGHSVAAAVMRFVKLAGSFAGNSSGGKEHAESNHCIMTVGNSSTTCIQQ